MRDGSLQAVGTDRHRRGRLRQIDRHIGVIRRVVDMQLVRIRRHHDDAIERGSILRADRSERQSSGLCAGMSGKEQDCPDRHREPMVEHEEELAYHF
jgi:hypothetical protein